MRKKFLLGIIVIVACIGVITFITNKRSKPHEISLKEAYSIGLVEAKKWNNNAKLIYLTSVDDANTFKGSQGSNGKRYSWNMIFGDIQKQNVLILNVKNGGVDHKQVSSDSIQEIQLIEQNDLILDSTEMVELAKKNKLKPGVEWAKGYHFTIEKDENGFFFSVVGLNKDQKFTRLYFNPKTAYRTGKPQIKLILGGN
ncbi:hypothetical protein B1A99_25200 [Cohnella sp. CIP 111063]|uniref:hypothetical protein n=1 Tax=unclassified Cohnella TaxID=2636738 RepID=UPI000B8C1989|nr:MULTISPECIES: hypothetical protein [unclassified Cohnella]OXS55077.1 hypothetical protein B1A99_25200 [Cohnella sp. CIP 111063]PRX65210.1 hypothetical protein B0G52_118163 [Cohnella sp. SGD-V74]